MAIISTINPFGTPEGLVDKAIGDAYPNVRHVAENMEFVKHVSHHMANIYRVGASATEIDHLADKILMMESLESQVDEVLAAEASIASYVTNTPASSGVVSTYAVLLTKSFGAQVQTIHTSGYATLGDGGHGSYIRVASEPPFGGVRLLDRYLPNGTIDNTHGGWLRPVGLITPSMYGGDAAVAASTAFHYNTAFFIPGNISAKLSVTLATLAEVNDGPGRHQALMKVFEWARTVYGGQGSTINIQIEDSGLVDVEAYDIGGGNVVPHWYGGSVGMLLTGRDKTIDTRIGKSIVFGARGESDYPIERKSSQYRVTFTLADAQADLPAHMVAGYSVTIKDVTGHTNDADVLEGGCLVEYVAPDRRSFRATLTDARTADMVSDPICTFTIEIPRTSIRYAPRLETIGSTFNITAATPANPMVVTVPGHNFIAHTSTNEQFVFIEGVVGTTQLNGRIYRVGVVAGDNITLYATEAIATPINGSGYSAYVSGGQIRKVQESWTGSDLEAYFNISSGARFETSKIGIGWGGWFYGLTGTLADQDTFFIEDMNSLLYINSGTSLAGAGDKILRAASARFKINQSGLGGGGCQSTVYGASGSVGRSIRSYLSGGNRETVIISEKSVCILSQGSANSGTVTLASITDSLLVAYPIRIRGGSRNLYAIDGMITVGDGTDIGAGTTVLDGLGGRALISGDPTINTERLPLGAFVLIKNGVGGSQGNRGGARWVASSSADQTPAMVAVAKTQIVEGTINVAAGGVINIATAGRLTKYQINSITAQTVPGTIDTINHTSFTGRINIRHQDLTLLDIGAGEVGELTINNTMVLSTNQLINAFVMGGTYSSGIPYVTVKTVVVGQITFQIHNLGAATLGGGGSLIIGYDLVN